MLIDITVSSLDRVIQDKLFQSDFDTFSALEKRDADKRDE